MIRSLQNYENVVFLIEMLDKLLDKGLNRMRLQGHQKHGDEVGVAPDDGGQFMVDVLLGELEEVLDKALAMDYHVKINRQINGDEDL